MKSKKTLSQDLVPTYGMRYRPSCAHFQNTNSKLINIRASLLDILETGDTYYEIDGSILKMKKAEPIFCNPAYKNSELLFCFLFLLRVLNASFSYVFFFERL